MFKTPLGTRSLEPFEASMVRAAVLDILNDIQYEALEGEDRSELGIAAFDQLVWTERLELLCDVTHRLLKGASSAQPLTLQTRATVGAIFAAMKRATEMEIDYLNRHPKDPDPFMRSCRRRIRAAARKCGRVPPDLSCDIEAKWFKEIDCLCDRVVDDHNPKPPPEPTDEEIKKSIEDGTYLKASLPRDPMEVAKRWKRLERLCTTRSGNDAKGKPRSEVEVDS